MWAQVLSSSARAFPLLPLHRPSRTPSVQSAIAILAASAAMQRSSLALTRQLSVTGALRCCSLLPAAAVSSASSARHLSVPSWRSSPSPQSVVSVSPPRRSFATEAANDSTTEDGQLTVPRSQHCTAQHSAGQRVEAHQGASDVSCARCIRCCAIQAAPLLPRQHSHHPGL